MHFIPQKTLIQLHTEPGFVFEDVTNSNQRTYVASVLQAPSNNKSPWCSVEFGYSF